MILISHTDAAKIAAVSRRTIRRWLATGRLTDHDGLVDADELAAAKNRARPRPAWLLP